MSVAQRFLFDLSFDGPGEARARGPVTPAEPSFSLTELAGAEARARADGYETGRSEAIAEHERQIAQALATIGQRLGDLIAGEAAARADRERTAIALTRSVLEKLFPALARNAGFVEISALLARYLREAIDEPRLVLRVPDAVFEAAQQQLAPLADAAGYAGKVVLLADETLGASDCRIEWADGGAERDLGGTWADIETALARACDTPDGAAVPAGPASPPAAP